MYLIQVFILFELCLLFLNSCIQFIIYYFWIHVFIQFMYLLFLNSCIYYFWIYYVLTIFDYLFLFIIISRHVFCYPFYDLMIFIYNPKELKLHSRKQYK